jgi:dipeptidyl-peptidase-4
MKRFFFILVLISFRICIAQPDEGKLTLEKIYKERILRTRGIREIRWLQDGSGYTSLEPNEKAGCSDIVFYAVRSGERMILVSASDLVPDGRESPLDIEDYTWSEQSDKVLIFTDTRRVWRYNTRGDYWVFHPGTGKLHKLGKGLEGSSLMFAKFSPDGTKVAYVSRQNLYVENLSDGRITRLTDDGGGNIINGTFDWVYEEELDCRDGFRWSPDGKYIAYWQSDTEGTGIFYMINNLDSLYPEIISVPYPKAGTTNSSVKVGVVPVAGGNTRWFPIPGDPRNHYLARMDFIPGTNELMIQQLNRRQNTNKVWIGNAETMQVTNILTETDEAWVDMYDHTWWIGGNQYFTWTSERDGWRHLYRVSRDGKEIRILTTGNFDVIDMYGIDEKYGYVYFTASPENFTQRYLYRSALNKPGSPELICPADQKGQHAYELSPDFKYAVHTFHNNSTPPQYSLVTIPAHKTIRKLEMNEKLQQELAGYLFRPKEFFRIPLAEADLDAWMIKPPGFDPTKKYPVIFYVYGEPASSTVQDSWSGGDLWHQYLAQQGYIVMSIDNRGTATPRGREWRKCLYKKIGVITSHDQAEALKRILGMYSFVDPERMGMWGWSGGGSTTLNCLFRYPDLYAAGIAVAFVSDLRLYDTIYQERYSGLPDEDKESYEKGSPVNFASGLKGKLMLVHGTNDDNVHYQNCEILVDELVKQGKVFDLLAYPMRSHGIYERDNTTYHLRLAMDLFWKKNLEPGGK